MDIGKLDRRISILTDNRSFVTANAFNEKVEEWGEYISVWAAYRPVMSIGRGGTEALKNGQISSDIIALFIVRWSKRMAQIDPTYRLRFEDRDWDISAVKEMADQGRRDWLEITATARAEAA